MNHEPETVEQWAARKAEELAKACGEVDCQCPPISDSEREYLTNVYETCEPPKAPKARATITPAMAWATLIFMMVLCSLSCVGLYTLAETLTK